MIEDFFIYLLTFLTQTLPDWDVPPVSQDNMNAALKVCTCYDVKSS